MTVRGVSCLITNPGRSAAILQRKDASYPVPRFRHTLACFGGQAEPGEPPQTAIWREIEEEIIDVALRTAVLACLRPAGTLTTSFGHRVHCYLAVLADFGSHAARIAGLPQRLICAEGEMEVLAIDDLGGMSFAWDAGLIVRVCLAASRDGNRG